MKEDPELLRCFVREKSEAAFRELVQRRIDFVYGAALRQVGDVHLAEEVAQNVFLDLARKARTLAERPNLVGWLYTSTRFAAGKALRTRARRVHYETEAHAMHEILSVRSAAEVNWAELRPVLDKAMHELGEQDREAILLRYFDGRSLGEVGANLGLTENTARMRVERALEKLRERLARRGFTSTAAVLGAVLGNQPTVAAPLGLVGAVVETSLAAGAMSGVATAAYFLMTTKLKIAALCAIAALGTGAYLVRQDRMERKVIPAANRPESQTRATASLQKENQSSISEPSRLDLKPAAPDPSKNAAPVAATPADAVGDAIAAQRVAITHNLRQISAARSVYILEERKTPSLADLVGPGKLIKRLVQINGEDYSRLELDGEKPLAVTTLDGATVSFESSFVVPPSIYSTAPPWDFRGEKPPALRAALGKALEAYRNAHEGRNPREPSVMQLIPYFENTKDAADFTEWLKVSPSTGRTHEMK